VRRRSSTLIEGTLTLEASGDFAPPVSAAVLAGFAEALVLAGPAPNAPDSPGRRSTVTNLTLNRLADPEASALDGMARCVADNGARQVFQVEIRAPGDDRIAVVVTAHVENVILHFPSAEQQSDVAARSFEARAVEPAAVADNGPTNSASRRIRHLIDAASRVFAVSGYGNASMREVASEAGMPIATMYQYVTGKEQLLLFVFEIYVTEILEALDHANDKTASPRERLRDCIWATLVLYDKYRAQIRLIHQEGRALGADNRERVRSLARSTRRIWEGILNDGVKRGDFRCVNPVITASLVPALCATWVLRRPALGDHTLDELRDAIFETLERSPSAVLEQAGSEPVAVLNHNRPAAYLLSPEVSARPARDRRLHCQGQSGQCPAVRRQAHGARNLPVG
jgi:AcrR family transcriptional regulator